MSGSAMKEAVPAARNPATLSVPGWSRRDVTIERLLFLGLFFLYLAVSRHAYIAYDANAMVAVTHNLVDHFTLRTTGAWDDYIGLSTPWAPYGIGLSIAIVPLYVLSRAFGHEGLFISLYNPVVVAATAALIFRIGREMRWTRLQAGIAVIVFGVLTMALQSTTELFSEPSVGLCVAILILAILKWQKGSTWAPLAVGLTLAIALQLRSDSIATVWVSLLAVPFFVPWKTILRPATIAKVGIPMAVSLVLLCWYNEVRYSKLFVSAYGGVAYNNPLIHGIHGLLFSWGKGFFVYNPMAILGAFGLIVLLWRRRPIGTLFVLMVVVRVLLFAKWGEWEGGVCWGPRLIMPLLVPFAIAAVELLNATMPRSRQGFMVRAAFVLLAVPSIGINYLSVRVPYEQWWQLIATPSERALNPTARALLPGNPSIQEIGHLHDFAFDESDIRGDIDLLSDGKAEMAPELWLKGDSYLGWILLALSALCLIGAGVITAGYPKVGIHVRGPTPAASLGP